MAERKPTTSDGTWPTPELSAEELARKAEFFAQRVRAPVPSQTRSVADMVRAFSGMSIQARNLGSCYEVLEGMLRDPDRPTILLGVAGPLIAGGLRQVIRELVEFNLVDVVVSTGAILYQDLYQARGYAHYRGSTQVDDAELRELYVDRIYDTYVDEIGFAKTDTWIGHVADTLAPGAYSSRQVMDVLADHGHRYALQITTAVSADGGLSGSTLEEAESWGKVQHGATRAMAWVEPTVSLPLLTTAAIEEELYKGRSRLRMDWDGQVLTNLE